MTSASARRAEVDRCPGVLRAHRAADGALLRLRIPGGHLPAAALNILSAASTQFSDGDLQLTSRGNLQLRGVQTDTHGAVATGLVEEVVRAGLLSHPVHERVRNIVSSPMTGRSGGLADVRRLTASLDEQLCATEAMAGLPGPFLFVLDDGRGDLDSLAADIRVRAVDERSVQILVGDVDVGPVVAIDRSIEVIIGLGLAFLALTSETGSDQPIWHVRELPRHGLELWPRLTPAPALRARSSVEARTTTPFPEQGVLTQRDGRVLLSTIVPLGLLDRSRVRALLETSELGSRQVIITPWRGVIIPDLDRAGVRSAVGRLSSAGLELSDLSPWRGVTACTGAPRCAQGAGETRLLAGRIVTARAAAGPGAAPILPVHVVGCARRCGSPAVDHLGVLTGAESVALSRDDATVTVRVDQAAGAVAAAVSR